MKKRRRHCCSRCPSKRISAMSDAEYTAMFQAEWEKSSARERKRYVQRLLRKKMSYANRIEWQALLRGLKKTERTERRDTRIERKNKRDQQMRRIMKMSSLVGALAAPLYAFKALMGRYMAAAL